MLFRSLFISYLSEPFPSQTIKKTTKTLHKNRIKQLKKGQTFYYLILFSFIFNIYFLSFSFSKKPRKGTFIHLFYIQALQEKGQDKGKRKLEESCYEEEVEERKRHLHFKAPPYAYDELQNDLDTTGQATTFGSAILLKFRDTTFIKPPLVVKTFSFPLDTFLMPAHCENSLFIKLPLLQSQVLLRSR